MSPPASAPFRLEHPKSMLLINEEATCVVPRFRENVTIYLAHPLGSEAQLVADLVPYRGPSWSRMGRDGRDYSTSTCEPTNSPYHPSPFRNTPAR